MKRILLISFVLMASLISEAFAQRTVSGKVASAVDGEGIPGVTVRAKGTTVGVNTDFDGNYRLSVPEGSNTLEFSFVGFINQQIEIGNRSVINVTLEEDVKQLEEVVVVGYQSLKKSDLTSSISTVAADMIQNQPIASIDNLLQGTAPGVLVTSQNGRPGGQAYVRIRGVGSANASNEPLFVVDGVQVTSEDYNAINPNDIKEISILKDAASTAIYGSRASNGVVLVTTKRGSGTAKPQIQYKGQYGVKEMIPLNFDMMNKEEKLRYEQELGIRSAEEVEALRNDLSAPDTDWQDVLLRTGNVQTHDLSIAGSGEKVSYYISLSDYQEEGISKGSNFGRTSGRINMQLQTTDWLKVGNTLSISRTNEDELRDRNNVQNPFRAMFSYNPYEPEFILDDQGNPVLDENGEPEFNLTRQGFSISEAIKNTPETATRTNAIGSIFAEASIGENLKLRSSIGGNYRIYRREYYITPGSVLDGYVGDPNAPGIKTDNGSDRLLYTWTNTATYDWKINDAHKLNFLAGTEIIKSRLDSYSISGKGFPSRDIFTQDNAAEITGGRTGIEEWAIWSQFGQVNYNINDRYIFSGSLRRDGSSRFGSGNKYGIFWAGSAAWNIAEEGFFNVEGVEQLKLRTSVGTSGNVPDELYAAPGLYEFGSYGNLTAAYPSQLENPDLQWESSFNYTVGLDFGVLNNRLSGSFDYYTRETDNLLFDRQLSRTVGFNSRLENVGMIKNSGVELQLVANVINTGSFRWTLSGSIATNANEVVRLDNGGEDIINEDSGVTLLREGLPVNNYYLVRYAGVNPANGEPLYLDTAGMVSNNYSADYAVALEGKSPLPTFFGNFGTRMSYKGFGLDANFYYQGGNYVYNFAYEAVLLSDGGSNARGNQRVDAFNYWKQPGDENVLPKPSLTNNINSSDRYLQRGDYIRLRNVMLSYSLPTEVANRIKLAGVSVFVQGTNLWTFNPYFSGDPEVGRGSEESDLETMGEFTLFTYPNTRGATVGLNITL